MFRKHRSDYKMNCFVYILLLASVFGGGAAIFDHAGIVRRYAVQGLAGESIKLPCEVDISECGYFHNIKWYKGSNRVYVFSERDNFKRAEGALADRTNFDFATDRKENFLEIFPLVTGDEGTYRCEITYMVVKDVCSIVQFTNLTTFAVPTSHKMSLQDGTNINNGTTIGPFDEGTTVDLKCESGGGKPVPQVTWWNGTREITGDYRATMNQDSTGTGVNTLSLVVSRGDLSGEGISCRVENEAMPRPASLHFKLNVNVAPEMVDVLQLQPTPLREGALVTLRCDVRGARPPATITWYNGSVPIERAITFDNIEEDTGEIEELDGTYNTWSRLEFKGTRFENQRTFSCQAMNDVLKNRGQRALIDREKLDVQFAPSVRITPSNVTVNESMDILIRCQYDANPMQLNYALWYQDNEQLDVAGKPEKYGNGNVDHPSLLIKNATARDSGVYTCRLTNDIGDSKVIEHSTVTVQYPPEVQIVMEPSNIVSEDEEVNVTLICDVRRANPQGLDRVRWFINEKLLKELPECNGNETLYDDNSDLCGIDPSRLVLEKVRRNFHGNYSCEGMNEAGWGTRSPEKQLIVNHPPGNASITHHPWKVIKGESLTLNCNLNELGRPETNKVRWYRGGRLVPDETSLEWRIDPVSLETEANFTCVPYNSEGEGVPADVEIDIMAKPFFISRPSNYKGFLINSPHVSLTCRVECSPLCRISWLKNGQPLKNTTHYNIISTEMVPDPSSGDLESVESTLEWKMDRWPNRKLDKVRDNHNYTCVSSSNAAGPGVSSHTSFRVEFPPERISVTQKYMKVVENESPPRVACEAYSYPEPNYEWSNEEGEIVSSGSVFYLSYPVSREQAGKYTCTAENKHGQKQEETYFDILYKPECAIRRVDEGGGEDAQIALICEAVANPQKVDFRWRFGNETITDDITNNKLESKLLLPAIVNSLGTYYCYVNNSVGESIPCEIDVTGVSGIMQVPEDNFIMMIVIIVAVVVFILVVIIIIIILCRRYRQAGKYQGSGNLQDRENKQHLHDASSLHDGGIAHTKRQLTLQSSSDRLSNNIPNTLNKWPLKPGVHVHVNSLTSLADETKPLYNNNILSVTTASGKNTGSSMALTGNEQVNKHHLNYIQALNQQKLYPTATLDKRSSSSSSSNSSASSSSNLINPRKNQTLPRNIDMEPFNRSSSTKLPKQASQLTLNRRGSKDYPSSDTKYYHTDRRPGSISKAPDAKNKPNTNRDDDQLPEGEPKQFYENLPFHTMAPPPNKNRKGSKLSHFQTNSHQAGQIDLNSTHPNLPPTYQAQYQRPVPPSSMYLPSSLAQSSTNVTELNSPPTYSHPLDIQTKHHQTNPNSYYQKPSIGHQYPPSPHYSKPLHSSPHHYSQPNPSGKHHNYSQGVLTPPSYHYSQPHLNQPPTSYNPAQNRHSNSNTPTPQQYLSQTHLANYTPSSSEITTSNYPAAASAGPPNKYAMLQFNGPIVGQEIDV